MNKTTIALCSVFVVFAQSVLAEELKVESKPLQIGALSEFGYINKGFYRIGTSEAMAANQDWVDHFGAFLTKEVTVEERLHLSAGIGGVFQFRKPEEPGTGFNKHQRKGFFSGPTKTDVVYDFGEIGNPWLQIGAGMFGYKYNPQAYNLGEYLFRAGGYPTYMYTGGYVQVNSAGAGLQGLKAHLHLGNFNYDMMLLTETGLAPLYDFSWAHVLSYKVADGLLDLGLGVNFQRLLSVRPSRTAAHRFENSYFEYKGKTYVGMKSYYENPAIFNKGKADELKALDSVANAVAIANYEKKAAAFNADAQIVGDLNALSDTALDKPKLNYISASAVLLMARATFDPKKLFEIGVLGPEDLKIYSELNVLGIKNYPIYYDKIIERMPIMVGINLPGFKVLDLIAVQGEYFNSPWLNNTSLRSRDRNNSPYMPGAGDKLLSKNEYNDAASKDNLKWSVLIQKNLGGNLSLRAQAANDHLHLPSSSFYVGPQFDHNEITVLPNHWYWMTQLSWGI